MKLKNYIQAHKNEIDDLKTPFFSDRIFEKKLQKKLHSSSKKNRTLLTYLTIAACLVLGLLIGINFINNQQEKQELMANLKANSTGDRLKGIYNFSDSFMKEDTQIIEILIKILHKDQNTNVKIATIDALLRFPQNKLIRENLLIALDKEKTPLVQIKLIKSLSFLREKRAQKSLKKIIDNQQTFPIVKNNATLAINHLN